MKKKLKLELSVNTRNQYVYTKNTNPKSISKLPIYRWHLFRSLFLESGKGVYLWIGNVPIVLWSVFFVETNWFLAFMVRSGFPYHCKKMKFSIKDFFSKCDQIHRKLRIWSHLPKKSLMGNFIFYAVHDINYIYIKCSEDIQDVLRVMYVQFTTSDQIIAKNTNFTLC